MRPALTFKKHEVRNRLVDLGVTADLFENAARQGFVASSAVTAFEPKMSAGFVLWSKTLGSLAELGAPLGLMREDPAGHCLVVNRAKRVAFAVAAGDSNVGNHDPARSPRTRIDRGIRSEEAVQENQIELFPELICNQETKHPLAGFEFWWLLMHHDVASGELRLELSRGISLDKDRCISSWAERIMLPAVNLGEGGVPVTRTDDPNGSQGGEFDVTVTRRLG